MGRMKHGKPQPHANKKKVIPRQDETKTTQASPDDTDESFRKRKVDTSQADRYQELPDEYSSDNGNDDDYDETKDIEYVKKHYSGVVSHFQFKEEKEWEEVIKSEKYNSSFLELNLTRLANDLSTCSVYEKLHLSEMDDEISYCVNPLKGANNKNIQANTSNLLSQNVQQPTLEWNFTGIDKYKHVLTRSRKPPQKNSGTRIDNMRHHENNAIQSPNITGDIQLHRENSKNSSLSDHSEGSSETVAAVKESCSSMEPGINIYNCTTLEDPITQQEDLDLDILLETTSIQTEPNEDQPQTVMSNTNNPEVKELDDWLDSILD